NMVRVILKVGRKGVLILPKSLREAAGIGEGEVSAEARDGEIVIKPLKPRVVDIDHQAIRELLGEEEKLEEEKLKRILREVCS
ncbi:MAG: AbrB/MazE/SpoVT family DNA-binding domain-containing protein, partial [Candidatus Bathyarchaeia archaeon]